MRLTEVHFSGDFLGGFDFLRISRNSTRKPLNLIKSPIFTNTPCKSPFLYIAPSLLTVEICHGKCRGLLGQQQQNTTARSLNTVFVLEKSDSTSLWMAHHYNSRNNTTASNTVVFLVQKGPECGVLWASRSAHAHAHARMHIYIYIYACNLTWWAVLGFQDSMKQQEIRRNKGKKTKKLRKKRPNIQQNSHVFVAVFLGHFHYKTGHFLRFLPIFCPPIEITAIYIYTHTLTIGWSRCKSHS